MNATANGVVSLSLPLPRSADTRIYLRLSIQAKAVVLSLTTATQHEGASLKPMGSFVYALPNVSLSLIRFTLHHFDLSFPGVELLHLFHHGRLTLPWMQRFDDKQPLATTLIPSESSIEFTTRLAKLLARRVQLPVYVTNSASFANAAMGGTVEEEMEAFKGIAEVTLDKLREAGVGALAVNGSLS